ncbi:hypothetical protein B0H12DRAFT_1240348, partial [Mycena haematopus]
ARITKKREIEAAAAEVRAKNKAYVEQKKKAAAKAPAKAPKPAAPKPKKTLKQLAEDDDESFDDSGSE